MSEERKLAKNTVFLTGGLVCQKVLSFVYFLILARLLGKDTIGKYLYALSFMTAFSTISDLGFQQAVIREVAQAKERAVAIAKNAIAIRLILSLAAAIILVLIASGTETDPIRLNLIRLAGLVIVLDAVQITLFAVLRGFQNLRYEAVGVVIGQAITVACGATFLILKLPVYYLMFALAAGSLWNAAYAGYFASRAAGQALWPRIDWGIAKQLAIYAVPFALSAIFVKVYSSADSIILGKLAGNAELAAYGIPYKFTFAFQFIPIALAAALYPAFTNLVAKNEKEKASELFSGSMRYLMLIVLPLVAGMITLATPLMSKLYGGAYATSGIILTILSFALISAFLGFPVGSLLNGARKQNIQVFWMGITVIENIILNIILIPRYGAVGAAIAAVIGNFTLFFGGLSYVPKIISPKLKHLSFVFLKISAAAVLMGLVVHFAGQSMPLAGSVILGVITYIVFVWLLRAAGKGDIQKIKNIFSHGPEPAEPGKENI